MCNNQVKQYTNARYISKNSATQAIQFFPCGYCADCIRKKRSEWSLRAYYEAKRLFTDNPNAFCLFDTLTYSLENVSYFHDVYHPALYNWWDFKCFNRTHVQKFFKRLRINLKRACYNVDGNLRYLLTSEYGHDDEYIDDHGRLRKGQEMPHYHVFFYVNFDIDPLVFSSFISSAWTLGRTDGVPYKHKWYVLRERVIRNGNIDKSLKLVRYVSKYIGKDMYLYRKLYRRVFNSFTIHNPNWQNSYNGRLAFRRFKNHVLPFHFQSSGFGLSALEFENNDYIMEYGAIRMPVSNVGVVASIPLSGYYRRKLFYDAKWFDGRIVWFPKKIYYDFKLKRIFKSIISFRNRLFSWNNSLGIEKATDIARYQLIWRGVLLPRNMLNISDNALVLLKIIFHKSFEYVKRYGQSRFLDDFYVNYSSGHDAFIKGKHISDFFDNDIGIIPRTWSLEEFFKSPPDDLVLVDQSDCRFAGYDDILDSFYSFLLSQSKIDDFQQYKKDKQSFRYKQLGLLNC